MPIPSPNFANQGSPVVLQTTEGLPLDIAAWVAPWFNQMNQQSIEKRKTEEQHFAELDVQPGDRIRLTEIGEPRIKNSQVLVTKPDGATLEGVVKKVKFKDGRYKVQVEGFDVAGNGIFWPIRDYKVEVLHRAYRWTPEDRLIAELAGLQEIQWVKASETYREDVRQRYSKRAERIKRMLG